MAEFKKSLLTAGIGALSAIAAGGVKALNNLTVETPVVYRTLPVQSSADWWWTQIMWWLVPTVIALLLGGIMYRLVVFELLGNRRKSKGDTLMQEFERWRVGRLFGEQEQTKPPTQPEQKSIVWLTLNDALLQSKERTWIIGQAHHIQPDRAAAQEMIGKTLTVDYQTTQFAVLGGSGGGKTSSTGMLLLLYAKRFNLHSIVLDGKDGLDWGTLGDSGVVEWHAMTEGNIKSFLQQLKAIYDERHALMRSAGVGEIYALPTGKRPQPLFVIIEEFGRTWARVNHDKEVALLFDDLFCLGRAAGIILCPIEQAPEVWTRAMRANAKTALCYATQGEALKAFGEHFVSQLPQRGVFSKGNVFWRAWHTASDYKDFARLPRIQHRYLVEEKPPKMHEPTNEPQTNVTNTGSLPTFVPEANNERTNERQTATPMMIPPSLMRSFVRDNDWDKAAMRYFEIYPDAEHIDWCKAMAVLAADGREYTSFKGGLSQRLYHAYSPRGKKYMRLAS